METFWVQGAILRAFPGLLAPSRESWAKGGSKQWMFRFGLAGKTREAGLGSYPTISLAKARDEAERWRKLVADGIDPIADRDGKRENAERATARLTTFQECARGLIASHEAS